MENMIMENKVSKEVQELIQKLVGGMVRRGIDGLLPQNLPDELFEEILAIINRRYVNKEESLQKARDVLMFFVLGFVGYNRANRKTGYHRTNEKELADEVYFMEIKFSLESLRRKGIIDFEPLPTAKDILYGNMKCKMKINREHPMYEHYHSIVELLNHRKN